MKRRLPSFASVFIVVYIAATLLPLYWMLSMSLRTNEAILGAFAWAPESLSWNNYRTIFTDASWYSGYINSMIYVAMNTVLSVTVALPAAYAFSRYRFLGDKHLFFWLLTNRMTPPAVFLLPFFQLYSTLNLTDTYLAVALAHMVFNVPLAVWILEGFMSGIPRQIDETAWIDGYAFPRFFLRIFLPLIKAGVGVTAFFCFMFSWVELLLARTAFTLDPAQAAALAVRKDCHDLPAAGDLVGHRHGAGRHLRLRRGQGGDLVPHPFDGARRPPSRHPGQRRHAHGLHADGSDLPRPRGAGLDGAGMRAALISPCPAKGGGAASSRTSRAHRRQPSGQSHLKG